MKNSLITLALGLVAISQLSATPIIIDPFAAGGNSATSTANGVTVTTSDVTATVLGGTRYIEVTCYTATFACSATQSRSVTYDTDTLGGVGALSTGSGVKSTLLLYYLIAGGVDISAQVAINSLLATVIDDGSVNTTGYMKLTDGSAQSAQIAWGPSTNTAGYMASIPLTAFTTLNGLLDLTNITRIDFFFDTRTAAPGDDLNIDLLFADEVPEPSTYVLLGSGLLLIGAFRNRFRRS